MKIVEINGGVFGSTGKIMFGITQSAIKYGDEVMCFSPVTLTNRNKEPSFSYTKIGTYFSRRVCVLIDMITGMEGSSAFFHTVGLLRKISKFKPDLIHIHSIHGSYLNISMLFSYIKRKKIKVVWTLHDCWSFTGHCPHFDNISCEKWKTGCYECPLYKEYPRSLIDNSKKMWVRKKKWFSDVKEMVIVTPSRWMASKVKDSYLSNYPCVVINNGIDLSVFKPCESNFREKHGLNDKWIVLGVSFGWGNAKGLDVFIKLANELPSNYQIILIGTDDTTDALLPSNIISIHMTHNQKELAEIYSAADVFVNPTRQDTFPTVNIEALACGTPVLTFDVGGSPEIIDGNCGRVVAKDDVESLINRLQELRSTGIIMRDNCSKRAVKNYNQTDKYKEYIELFHRIKNGLCEV